MEYQKTKYPNILTYETKSGTRYRIRKSYRSNGQKSIIDESGFKTLAQVKARLRELESDLDNKDIDFFRKKNMTVSNYYESYANRKTMTHSWSKVSRYGNDSIFNKHVVPKYGNTPLVDLNRPDYEIYINSKLEKLSKASVKAIHVMFMALLNDAVYEGIIERNKLQRISIGKSKIETKNKRLSLEDYQKWMEAAERILTKYEYSIIYLCAFGLRRGEVSALRASIVTYNDHPNLATLKIIDTRTQLDLDGKGDTKTKSSRRFVILDAKGTEAIEYIIQEAKEIKKDFGEILHKDDFIILNPAKGTPYHPSQINRFFSKVSESCDIQVNPHMLRHFFATQAAIAGVPIEQAAAYLGHQNKTMTEHYTHIENETALNVVDLVSKRLCDGV